MGGAVVQSSEKDKQSSSLRSVPFRSDRIQCQPPLMGIHFQITSTIDRPTVDNSQLDLAVGVLVAPRDGHNQARSDPLHFTSVLTSSYELIHSIHYHYHRRPTVRPVNKSTSGSSCSSMIIWRTIIRRRSTHYSIGWRRSEEDDKEVKKMTKRKRKRQRERERELSLGASAHRI